MQRMSWAPLSIYSSPLVIYSSPLVIYSCCLPFYIITFWYNGLLDEFTNGLFKCSLHMTDYFLSLFEHLATIISQELSVLFLNILFQPIFHANGLLHVTHTAFSFHGGYMLSMSQYSFKCFMASCCSSTFNFSSFFIL